MSDHTGTAPRRHARRASRPVEYWVYFTIIYLVALPLACLRSFMAMAIDRGSEIRSPLTEARAMTEEVLPYIFMV